MGSTSACVLYAVPAAVPARRGGAGRQEKMTVVATYPDSTKTSLEQRLRARARDRWPQIASLQIRHRGVFSYVDATLTDATTLKLCRLRYVGSASQWQFAIYRASHDDYDESVFFTGLPSAPARRLTRLRPYLRPVQEIRLSSPSAFLTIWYRT